MSSITNAMKQQEMWRFIRDRTVTRSDYREINFQEHKMIIKALEERNASEAVTRMTDHMQNLYDRYWKS